MRWLQEDWSWVRADFGCEGKISLILRVMWHAGTTVLNDNICAFNQPFFGTYLVYLTSEKREKNIS
jgi:hypothetical protein